MDINHVILMLERDIARIDAEPLQDTVTRGAFLIGQRFGVSNTLRQIKEQLDREERERLAAANDKPPGKSEGE